MFIVNVIVFLFIIICSYSGRDCLLFLLIADVKVRHVVLHPLKFVFSFEFCMSFNFVSYMFISRWNTLQFLNSLTSTVHLSLFTHIGTIYYIRLILIVYFLFNIEHAVEYNIDYAAGFLTHTLHENVLKISGFHCASSTVHTINISSRSE